MVDRRAPVLVVGMMGAGKSTVGAALAQRLGWPSVDTDQVVEAATGRTVSELFAGAGEDAFRDAERAAIRDALGAPGPRVVAVGGGAVLSAANRRAMADATVVWLRATPDTLVARIGAGADRPLLAGRGPGAVAALDVQRRGLYQEVADVVVDVDGRSVDEVTEAVLFALGAREEPSCSR